MSASEADVKRLFARSTQYPTRTNLRGSRPENPRHAFRITARPGQAAWFKCEDLDPSQFPSGVTFIDAPLAANGLPDITITAGLTKGESNISGGTYRFLDDKNELGNWLADKAINRVQLFGGTIEQFDLSEDDDLDDPDTLERALRYTFQIRGGIVANDNVYEFKCQDVNRDIDTEVFNREPFRLHSTIFATSNIIPITLPVSEASDHDYSFVHGPDYLIEPGERRAIVQIGTGDKTEYISYFGFTVETVNGEQVLALGDPKRGLRNTEPQKHDVGDDTPVENRPQMPHVAYCEESPASVATAIYTNRFIDGRAWTHGLNIDSRWVDVNSYARGSDVRRRTLWQTKAVNAKKFVSDILSKVPAIQIPAPSGALEFKPVQFFQQPTPRNTLDYTTCYGGDLSPLTHDDSGCKKTLILKWDKNPATENYRQETHITDTLSIAETQATEDVEYTDDTITTGRSTETEVLGIGAVMWAKHALPVKRLSAALAPELHHVRPGDVLQVDHYPADYKNGTTTEAPISTPMLVGTLKDRQKSGKVAVDLIGYQAPPPALLQGSLPMPESVYMENGIQLPGVVNNVAQGSAAINLNQKYYHLGDLTLPSSWAPNLVGNGDFELWVRGVLLWAVQLDGKGRGMPQGVRGYHEAPPAAGPWVAHRNFETDSGGTSTGYVQQFLLRSHPASTIVGRQGGIAEQINVERGRIVGLPAVLAGSGGAQGEQSTWKITNGYVRTPVSNGTLDGSAGANGGLGGKIVCFPGSGFVADGGVDCSGADGVLPTEARIDVFQAAGAGGAHGHWAFYTDGIGTAFQGVTSTSLTARNGRSNLAGERVSKASWNSSGIPSTTLRGYYDPPQDTSNHWQDAHTIGVIPASQTATDTAYSSAFNEFFEDQPDGRARVYEQVAKPSDGNKWDLWITPNQLRNGETNPILYVFDGTDYVLVDWANTRFATVYQAMLAIKRRGGNTLHYGSARPTEFTDGDEWFNFAENKRWILYAGKADVLIGVGDYAVGSNKWLNGNLAKFPEEQTVYVFDDLDEDPFLSIGVVGSVPSSGGGTDSGVFSPPAGLIANSTTTFVSLVWNAVASATKYNIDRAVGGGAFEYLTTTTSSAYADNTIVNGTTYRYRINAIRGPAGAEEYSGWSGVVTITAEDAGTGTGGEVSSLAEPTGFSAQVLSESEISLTWNAQSGNFDGFHILRSGQLIATKAKTDTSHSDSGLTAGTTFNYEIRTFDATDESAGDFASATTSQSTAPGGTLTAPTNLVVLIYSGTAAELQWTAVPAGNRGTGIHYEIEQDGVQIRITDDANNNSHFMGTLIPGTAYNWRIRLADGLGGVSPWVDVSGTTNL